MKDKFSKAELLGATRQILTEIAAWTDMLYGAGAAERLINTKPGRDLDWDDGGIASFIELSCAVKPRDWSISGSAGSVIERSLVLKHMGRVFDYLNSNIWHGDSNDFSNAKLELTPFHDLLDGAWSGHGPARKVALSYAIDDAVDQQVAASVFQVLKIFFARVHFEIESNQENESGELTLSELASISGLAEKTVRMAAVGQDKNPDLVTFKEGRWTFVRIEEARRWLASKNIDYRPPEFTKRHLLPPVEPENLGELGAYLRTVREYSEIHMDDLGTLLGWDETMIKAYEKLEDGAVDIDLTRFSLEVVMQLTQAICPAENTKLIRIIDRVIHPLLLEVQIEQSFSNSDNHE